MTVIAAAAAKAYDAMRFKEALKTSFYLMQEARDRYRAGTSHVGASEELVRQWAEWQALMMNPITPHWSEAIWEFLGKEGLCVHAKWPVPAVDNSLILSRMVAYLRP
jgi:leucyl-tRNA synthetase